MCSSNLLLHIFLKHFSLLYLPTCDMIMISFYPEIGGISHPVLILRSISSSDPPQIPLGSCFFFLNESTLILPKSHLALFFSRTNLLLQIFLKH